MDTLDDQESGEVISTDVFELDGKLYKVERQSVRRLETSYADLESEMPF